MHSALFLSRYFFWIILLVSFLHLPNRAKADIGSTYGFGSSTSALAGANRSFAYDGFALDRSPSLMSFLPTTNSYGMLGAKDFFRSIDNVQTDNFFNGGSSQTGNVSTDIPDTMSFLFGSVWALGKSEKNYRLGLTFSTPMDKVTEPNTNDAYQPSYSGYTADSQRLTISTGFSLLPTKGLSVGLGVNYYLVQAATYEGRMPTDSGGGRTSTGNLKMTVKPAIAPVAGVTVTDELNYLTLYFAGARDHKLKIKNDVLIGVVGTTPVSFDSETSLFYDPETWSLGYARVTPNLDWLASVDWERWSRYDGGYMRNSFRTFQTSFRQYPVEMNFKDILIYKTGFTVKWNDSVGRFGLAFRPSPHSDLDGRTNYIEPDRFVLGLGYGFSSSLFGLLDENIRVETHFQTHYLVPKSINKSDSTDIGAPGYSVGGYVFSYGLNLNVGI